jgi:hypothetical protein
MRAQEANVAKLQTLDDRLARLRAERGRLVARASHAARTLDTRRKILVGAAVLTALELGSDVPPFSSPSDLTRWLDGRLTRPHDRAVFELPIPANGQPPTR